MAWLRELLIAAAFAVAVVVGHRLVPPAPLPPAATAGEAEAAMALAFRLDRVKPDPAAAVSVRVYDVRDLVSRLAGIETEFRAVAAAAAAGRPVRNIGVVAFDPPRVVLPAGQVAAGQLADFVWPRDAGPTAVGWPVRPVGGRLVVTGTDADHARVRAWLAALRSAERVPRPVVAIDGGSR